MAQSFVVDVHALEPNARGWIKDDELCIRAANPNDGIAMWRLRRHNAAADRSPYGYFALLRHLSSSTIVAECDGDLVGFVITRRVHDDVIEVVDGAVDPQLPQPTATLFQMLARVLELPSCREVRYIDAAPGCDESLKHTLMRAMTLPLAKCGTRTANEVTQRQS